MSQEINIDEIQEQVVDENSGQFIVIIGRVGSGKSTMSSTFPNSLCLDLEGTASNIKGLKRLKIERQGVDKDSDKRDVAFLDICKYTKQFLGSDKYDTLILDGGLEFTRICQDFTLKKLGRDSMRSHKYADTYVDSREVAEKYIKKTIGKGKNLVIIAHIEEIVDVDPNTDEEYTIFRPLLGDKQLVQTIPALANIVGMLIADSKGERKFDCIQTSKNVLKNQFAITEKIEPTYDALFDKIKEFYGKA